MIETVRVDEWLQTTLAASAPLSALVSSRIFGYVAPQGATGNMVVYNWQGGADVSEVAGVRIMVNGLWQIKAIVQGSSFAPAKAIMDIVDATLHRASGSTSDALVLACVRQQVIQYVEVTNGIQYRHLGALFRVIVHQN